MRAQPVCLLLFIFLALTPAANGQYYDGDLHRDGKRMLFDFGWKFHPGDVEGAEKFDFNDSDWRLLDLPHDWSIEGKINENEPAGGNGGYYPTGTGWYRKHFDISAEDLKKIIWIEFDGVYMNSDLWVNGMHLGNRPYGYSSFYYDITKYLKKGNNVIAVRVDNSKQPNSRWYTGSGIYRNVWLIKQDKLHLAHWGVFVTTPEISSDSALVDIKTKIDNEYNSSVEAELFIVIEDNEGNVVASAEKKFAAKPGESLTINNKLWIQRPMLWSVDSPDLYTLKQSILKDGKISDGLNTVFGIRKIFYDANKGFFLNDKQIKMNGVCLHHDGGAVGAVVPTGVWEYRLKKLKMMGCNAIRAAHNPPAPEFLDLCDKMGFLVMDEAFDEWRFGKRKYGYHIYFDEWHERDLISMIHRDRNHPSIVIWSVGNEVPDQKTEEGTETLKKLTYICHSEDPTRPVTQACDNIAADGGSTVLSFLNALDIVGYNYVDRWHERRELYYSIDKLNHPDWKMIGTENRSNHGVFRRNYSLGDDPATVNPNYNYDMIDAEQLWKFTKMHDYVIGDFMWTGIDYLGEARWPFRSWNFGVLDLCGFEKDGYYFYQSQWTTKPMIHLFPHWNWEGREGQIIPVICYTNCNEVELFLNGKSYGKKRLEFPRQGNSGAWNRYANPVVNPTTADLHLQWDIPYEPGVIKAVGMKNGQVVCTRELRTAGEPYAIRLTSDRDTICVSERGVANIKVEVVDRNNKVVPTAGNLIEFSIKGKGKIIGVENGNPLDHSSSKSNKRKTYNGLALVVLQALNEEGRISLTAKSQGLKDANISIVSIKK
ncbi:glycoside hydrolase family 2 TIM barrel-domain containing protein [Melioribacter sp. Ez-97]|uniref:glycoside hydrolase family 2 TIM barrel-domain containing protein n=1 Tax=Melioribacter sp. Ez-97 TaxID=3423434 RepID=UPI003EDA41E4